MIYEQRIYSCIPGRMPALLKRFETQTLPIWKKHGLRPVGFWTVLVGDGNHDLHYMLAWELLAEREKIWNTVPGRSGLAFRPLRQREGRPDPRQHQELVPGADRILGDEVTPPWRAASITSFMRVHDLDAAAALYRALGFQVGARNTHRAVLGHPEPHRPARRQLHRGAHRRGHVADRAARSAIISRSARSTGTSWRADEGLSMLVLEGRDAQADARAFREAGIGDFDVFDFEREGKRPDGTPIKVAFSLAFASDPEAPDIGFFTCQHRFPENFWNPGISDSFQYGGHASPAWCWWRRSPRTTTDFLTAFTGVDEVTASTSGLGVTTPRGEIQVMDPASFERNFGEQPPDIGRGARLAALRIAVRNLGAANAVLRRLDLRAREYGEN